MKFRKFSIFSHRYPHRWKKFKKIFLVAHAWNRLKTIFWSFLSINQPVLSEFSAVITFFPLLAIVLRYTSKNIRTCIRIKKHIRTCVRIMASRLGRQKNAGSSIFQQLLCTFSYTTNNFSFYQKFINKLLIVITSQFDNQSVLGCCCTHMAQWYNLAVNSQII